MRTLLVLQGEQDRLGSLEQIDSTAGHRPATRLMALPDCEHSPQRDQPEALLAAFAAFAAQRLREADWVVMLGGLCGEILFPGRHLSAQLRQVQA